MEYLEIEATQTTPHVVLNAEQGIIEIEGLSNEQDALGFYFPIIQWLDTYITAPQEVTKLELRLKLFNTASSKALFEIFKRLGELKKKGKKVTANWYCSEEDDNLQEDIEYFNDMISLPINVINQRK